MKFYAIKREKQVTNGLEVHPQVDNIAEVEENMNAQKRLRVVKRPPSLEEARKINQPKQRGLRVVEMNVRPHVRGNGIEVRGHYRFRLYNLK
jgi:hypothetical protein